jgi:hypothetical protein
VAEEHLYLYQKWGGIVNKDATGKVISVFSILQLVCLLLIVVLSVFLYLNRGMLNFSPWETKVPIEWPAYTGGNGQRKAIIADSASSVYVLNNSNELVYKLEAKPGKAKSFNSAKFVEIDENNNLYIMDALFGGAFEENLERVLQFSKEGKFIRELYALSYTNENFFITKGKINGMAYSNGGLYLVRIEEQGFYLEKADEAGGTKTIGSFNYPNAFRDITYVHINAENRRLSFSTKSGTVKQYDFDGTVLYDEKAAPGSLPWTVVSYGDNLVYADILKGEIVLTRNDGEQTLLYSSPPEKSAYYRINHNGDFLFASPYDQTTGIAIFKDGESSEFEIVEGYSYSEDGKTLRILLFAGSLLDILLLVVFLVLLALRLSKISVGGYVKTMILAGGCIAFGAVISSLLIINEMSQRYNEKTYDGLENVSRLIAASVDIGFPESINSPSQAEDADYLNFKSALQTQFAELQFKGKRVYQTILKKQGETMYMLYDLENSVGTFFPFGAYTGYYEEVFTTKQFVRSQAISPEGSWLFVCGPILDQRGEVAAFIETGYDMRSMNDETRIIMLKTWLIVGAAVVVVLLAAALLIMLSKNHKKNR